MKLTSNVWDKISNNYSYSKSSRKMVRQLDESVQNIQDEIEGVQKTVRRLKNFSANGSNDRLEKYLEDFTKKYNKLKKEAKSVENEDLKKEISKLEDLLDENKKDLKKLGVKMSDDELEFDSEVFEDVREKDINKLFEGKDSFIKKLYKTTRTIDELADKSEYKYELKSVSTTIKYDKNTIDALKSSDIVPSIMAFQGDISVLTALNAQNNADKVIEGLGKFANSYNELKSNNTNIKLITDELENNWIELNELGLEFGQDDLLSFKQEKINADSFGEVYAELFDKNSDFVKALNNSCNTIFNKLITTENPENTIIDQQI